MFKLKDTMDRRDMCGPRYVDLIRFLSTDITTAISISMFRYDIPRTIPGHACYNPESRPVDSQP